MFWYEMGQKTVPNDIFKMVGGITPVAERGKAIVREMGWFKAIFDFRGPWGKTLSEGPTPGGLLALIGLGQIADKAGNHCGCD